MRPVGGSLLRSLLIPRYYSTFFIRRIFEGHRKLFIDKYQNRLPFKGISSSSLVMESRKDWKRKKFALIDLSGTLHVEDSMTPDASSALELLRCNGFKVLFVTNTTKESRRKLYERLTNMNFNLRMEEMFTSMSAARNFVEERDFRPMLLIADEALEDFEGIRTENPNSVLIGLSPKHFNMPVLSEAARLLLDNEKSELIAIHKGRKYRTSAGISLGPGPFIVALEMATGKTASVVGKPESKFYTAALKEAGCLDPSEAVMIGDDIIDDVQGAMRTGIAGILVKTGKFSPSELEKIKPEVPDLLCENFSHAVKMLLDMRNGVEEKD